jgi:RNA polymerase sigma factor (sigma-70 family)
VGLHDDELLRRFLAARRAGDLDGARPWWEALVTANFDRVRSFVVLQSHGRLSPHEQDDALQLALIKLLANMIDTFRGQSMGEWVEATRTLVTFACIDTQRRATVISKHERSLMGAVADDGEVERSDVLAYAAIEEQRRQQEDAEHEAEALRHGQAFLDWAIPQLTEKRRAVIELDRDEVPMAEIQKRLGMGRDAVYQSRSRALKDLAKLREEYWA